jgi:acetyl esterase
VRIYWPSETPGLPILVYFHGGGWVLCNLDTHDETCRSLAKQASCIVVSVDYRLAPEHRFPAAVEDCHAATKWVAENARSLGGDASRLAIGGDSAGGNLTASVALLARERGGPSLAHQLMIYPVTDARFDTQSYRDNGEGMFLTTNAMRWFWEQYLPTPADGANPHASPLRAEDLRGLPPATVITAEMDPLRDEGEAYGRRLGEAGVPVEVRRYDGVIHGFFGMTLVLEKARDATSYAANRLRESFAAI